MAKIEWQITILSGRGNFEFYLYTALAKNKSCKINIADRNLVKAQKRVAKIKQQYPDSQVTACALDPQQPDFAQQLKASQTDILIDAAGPFKDQRYQVPQTCIDLKIHYIDISNNREFVTQIAQLDEKAKENEVIVIAGASGLAGITSAVVAAYAERFSLLREINFGVTPWNKMTNGGYSLHMILEQLGKPFQRLEGGVWKTVYGWQDIHQHYYGDNLGLRWHANADIPELVLFPQRYPSLKTVIFHSGMETAVTHWLLSPMSWLSRAQIIKNWTYFYKPFQAISGGMGNDEAAIYIKMRGSDQAYQPLEINWTLVVGSGHAPHISASVMALLVNKILAGAIMPGAQVGMGLFSLAEFEETISDWNVYQTLEEKEN